MADKLPIPRRTPFTLDEINRIQSQLDRPVDISDIQFRPSAQGNVAYVEGWKALSLANEVFGFNGWSSEILSLTTDFVDIEAGKVSLGVSCMVRIYLKDGTFHDDIGYGTADNQRSKGAAYEKARKEAVTDAMKRALRVFGYRLGNCAYDKSYLRIVKSSGSRPPPSKSTNELTSRMDSNPSMVKVSNQNAPPDFVPKFQHPKTIPLVSEADSEPLVTEEQLFEFGSHLNEMETNDYEAQPAHSASRPRIHRSSGNFGRSEFHNNPNTITAVNIPIGQLNQSTNKRT